jgi:dihydropyrimidinase
MKTLVRNGTIVTANETYQADLLIEGERIALIGSRIPADPGADRVVDAGGKYVMPGGVDVHTHLDMPFMGTSTSDDFETGTVAAAFGGTTSIIDFAIQYRGQALGQGLEAWMEKAETRAVVDYGFHMIATDLPDPVLGEMDRLVDQGVTSFKLFMAYPGAFMLDDASIFRGLLRTAENGGLICMHAENGGAIDVLVKQALAAGHTEPRWHGLTRPTTAEGEATGRAIALAEMARAPLYIVHLSCADALSQVKAARDRGLPVYAETCPQYLFLSHQNLEEPGFEGAKYVCSPPVREAWNQEELWKGIASDDLQVVSTDHGTFTFGEQKQAGRNDFSKIPNGMPGIETRLMLLYNGGVLPGRISLNRFVEVTATAPARMFGLFPRKGTIAVGSDADLMVFDPLARSRISASSMHMRVDYNPYEGTEVTGRPVTVLSRGTVLVEDGKFVGPRGHGRMLKRDRFNPRVSRNRELAGVAG